MKKILTAFALAFLLVGCAKEADNHSEILEKIAALDNRVTALESSILSIQSAVGDGKFVQKVEEFVDPQTSRTTGVTVTYSTGEVVHFNIVPTDPSAGPVFSVVRNGAGELCWAVDGVIIQMGGKDVPVYQTPVFSIDDEGNLWVEVDGEKVNLGPVQNEGATLQDGIFTDIKVEADKIVLTLSDGSTVSIPFAEAFKLNIEKTEYSFNKLEAINIPYTVSAKTANTVVGVAGYSPKDFSVEVAEDKIVITPLSLKAAGVLLAYADSKVGLTSLVNLTVEAEGLEVTDEPFSEEADYFAEGEDGMVVANVVSNVEFDVKPVDEWIHLVSVKAAAYHITLSLDNNTTGAIRIGKVNLTKKGSDTVIQTITIAQDKMVEGGPKNLSKKGPANSYIVTAPGDYMFWTVKGNSDQVVGEVATAEILWETYNNAEAVVANSVIAEVSYANNYIFFSTPETLKPGNAVIAAKDAGGKILWSWHIWIPASEIQTVTSNIWDAPLMDRNLGALVAATADASITVESFGLTYQWGRKDPFVGAAAMGEDGNATVAGVALSATEGAGEADESKISLEQSIENPTLLGHSKNKDWLIPFDNTLWQNDVKTIYDPCPAGYRVPARNKEQLWHGSDLSTVAGWAEDTNWFTLGDPVVVFPFAGYRDDYGPDAVCHAYDRAVYWTAYASAEDGGTAYYVNVRKGKADYRKLSEAGKSRAGSVRCVAFDEAGIVPPDPDINPGGSVTDLGKDGTANSYIVSKAGEYKFKAVKGNSAESVGAAAKAEVLWETYNSAEDVTAGIVIASVSFASDYVTFKTPETLKPGNALIAVKDASDVILWSWHIWIPATEVVIQDAAALCGTNMMDRNLGALVAAGTTGDVDPLSIGLYFQWGRKDPFPGMCTFESNTGAKVAGTEWTAKGELITTEYSIQHPTEYAHIKDVDEGVWNVDDPKDLWNTEDNKKTIYDPCPAGYRVPLYDKSLPMWAGSFDDANWKIGDANRFSYGDIVFPIGGYIDCWTPAYEKIGMRTHIWASSWYDDTRSNCLYYRGDKDNKYYSQKFHKAKAGSVRCVAE